jgi:UDP-glucose 6-dehydrogenase
VLVSSGLGTLAGDGGVLFSPWALGCVCIDKDKQCITELKDGQMPLYERGLRNMVSPRPPKCSLSPLQRRASWCAS